MRCNFTETIHRHERTSLKGRTQRQNQLNEVESPWSSEEPEFRRSRIRLCLLDNILIINHYTVIIIIFWSIFYNVLAPLFPIVFPVFSYIYYIYIDFVMQ